MKNVFFLLLVICVTTLNSKAQSLNLSDLEKLVYMNASDKQDYLISKQFDYWRTRKSEIAGENVTSVDYGKSKVSNGEIYHYKSMFGN
jgi:hypothetical protein